MIAALAAAAGVYFTGQSLNAARAQTAVVEEGQLTDRFTKAVDQLDRGGPDHLQARLGGIYALERLARDSPRDQPTIVEVLAAFIRTTAHRPDAATVADCPRQNIVADVQAALTVLGRRDTSHDGSVQIDLTETCLPGASLSGSNLHNVIFVSANLRHTTFDDADLTDAHLTRADLTDADLTGVKLERANLTSADLTSVKLEHANLTSANLLSANLERANLTSANLLGANLTRALLLGTDLTHADHDESTVVTETKTSESTIGAWW